MRRRDAIALLGGAALLAARPVGAQGKAMPVIGLLIGGAGTRPQFGDGLSDGGFEVGTTVALEYRYPVSNYKDLPALAGDLVRQRVAVIAAFDATVALAAKQATATIPIVFESGGPVEQGLVASLARPGGNLTGISLMDIELMPKRIQLLSQLVPQVKQFALLVNPSAATTRAVIRSTQEAAQTNGMQVQVLAAASYGEIDRAFAALTQQHLGGLVVQPDPLFDALMSYLPPLANSHGVPAIYSSSYLAWSGGLISYGPNLPDANRKMGAYAAKILRGAKPADLPIIQPDKLELAINLKTADALGLKVPQSLLALADTVIE